MSVQPSKQGNKLEYEDETNAYEKHHAPGGCQFSRRYRRQYPGGVRIRPNDSILVLGVFGSTRPLPPYCPGFVIPWWINPPLFTRNEAGVFFYFGARYKPGSRRHMDINQTDLVPGRTARHSTCAKSPRLKRCWCLVLLHHSYESGQPVSKKNLYIKK